MYNNITTNDRINIIRENLRVIENNIEHNKNAKNEELGFSSPSQIVLDFVESEILRLQQKKQALLAEIDLLQG